MNQTTIDVPQAFDHMHRPIVPGARIIYAVKHSTYPEITEAVVTEVRFKRPEYGSRYVVIKAQPVTRTRPVTLINTTTIAVIAPPVTNETFRGMGTTCSGPLTITLSGPKGSGKSLASKILKDVLPTSPVDLVTIVIEK